MHTIEDLKNIATAKKLIADYESKLTSGISSIFLADNYKIEKKKIPDSVFRIPKMKKRRI